MSYSELESATVAHLRALFEDNSHQEVRVLLDDLLPADIAELCRHLKKSHQQTLFTLLSNEVASEVISTLDGSLREQILSHLSDKRITKLVEEMDSDDAADVISELDEGVADEVLSNLDEDVSKDVKILLQYPDDSAGGIMSLEYVAIDQDATRAQAIDQMRELMAAGDVEEIYVFWIVDSYGCLVGRAPLSYLLLAQDDAILKNIMDTELLSVNPYEDQAEVARIALKYDLPVIPVVDDQSRLVGSITFDDLMDVLEEEFDEDQGLMSGTGAEDVLESSVVASLRERAPWLVLGLFGGMLSAGVVRYFSVSLDRMIAIAFFMPVVASTAGNVAMQSSSITVRGLATGEIRITQAWRRIVKEVRTAFFGGIMCGSIIAVVSGIWLADWRLSVLLAISLFCVAIFAGLTGSTIPFVLHKYGVDPAIASGPFLTTANDIMGLTVYFSIFSLFAS